MSVSRRALLKLAGLAPLLRAAPRLAVAADESLSGKADYTLRIGTGLVELSPEHIVSTTLYNGQFPGPLLRFKEGQRVVVDVYNDTDTPELVHWHGQMIPSDVDGAAEEGTPFVPAHGMRRVSFVPSPSGFRFYHTHVVAGGDLPAGPTPGRRDRFTSNPSTTLEPYDREVFLVMKEFAADIKPRRRHGDGRACSARRSRILQQMGTRGGRGGQGEDQRVRGRLRVCSPSTAACSGHGDPIRVKHGRARAVPRAQCECH